MGDPSWTMTGVSGRTLSGHVESHLPGVKSKDPGLVFDYGHADESALNLYGRRGPDPRGTVSGLLTAGRRHWVAGFVRHFARLGLSRGLAGSVS